MFYLHDKISLRSKPDSWEVNLVSGESKFLFYFRSFDEFALDIRSGRLSWTPFHKSEKFWLENATKLNESNFELLKFVKKEKIELFFLIFFFASECFWIFWKTVKIRWFYASLRTTSENTFVIMHTANGNFFLSENFQKAKKNLFFSFETFPELSNGFKEKL